MTRNNRGGFLNDNGAPVSPAGDSSQAALDAQWWPILLAANVGTGVVAGGLVTAPGGMNVAVAGATCRLLGVPLDIGAQTVTITPNNSGLRRFDLLIVRGGALVKLIGVPDGIACFAALAKDATSGELTDIALAAVLVLPGVTQITPEDITLLGVPPAGSSPGIAARKASTFLPHRRRPSGTASDYEVLWSYNGAIRSHLSVPIQDNCVTTSDGDVYTIYVNPTKGITLTQTLAGEDTCTALDLGTFLPGDPFETGTDWSTDSHDFMVVGISADGYLHVSGNMHAQSLKYARCQLNISSPAAKAASFANIANWSYATNPDGHGHKYLPMVPAHDHEVQTQDDGVPSINGVTYPNFVRISNGDLIFIYRWGASGKGDTYMNRWDTGTHAWVRVGKMIDELTPDANNTNYNAYPQKFVPGPNRDIHMIYCLRNTGSPTTNIGMYYIRFTNLDGAAGAVDSAGNVKVLPLSHDDGATAANRLPEVASPTAPTPSFQPPFLLNNGGACVDRDGFIHACVSFQPAAGNPHQNYHLWRDAAGWHQEQITSYPHGVNRNMIFAIGDGRVFIVGAAVADGDRNGIRCWECTPDGSRDSFLISEFDEVGELTFDTRAMDEHGLLRMFIGGGQGWYNDGGDNELTTPDTPPVAHWANAVAQLTVPRTVAGVLTIDTAQIDAFRSGAARLTGIKTIATDGYRDRDVTPPNSPNGVTAGDGWVYAGAGRTGKAGASDTTSRVMTAGPIITIGRTRPGRILFVRQVCAIGPVASGQWAATCIIASRMGSVGSPNDAPDTRRLAPIWVDDSDDVANMLTTSWCGLHQFTDGQGALGWITSQIWPSGGSGAWIGAQMIELGELDCG